MEAVDFLASGWKTSSSNQPQTDLTLESVDLQIDSIFVHYQLVDWPRELEQLL